MVNLKYSTQLNQIDHDRWTDRQMTKIHKDTNTEIKND